MQDVPDKEFPHDEFCPSSLIPIFRAADFLEDPWGEDLTQLGPPIILDGGSDTLRVGIPLLSSKSLEKSDGYSDVRIRRSEDETGYSLCGVFEDRYCFARVHDGYSDDYNRRLRPVSSRTFESCPLFGPCPDPPRGGLKTLSIAHGRCLRFPAVVGRPRNPSGIMVRMDARDCFVGFEGMAKAGILRMKHPFEKGGVISNYNDVEKLWHHAIYSVVRSNFEGFEGSDFSPLVHTVPSHALDSQKEKMCSILMETFNVPGLILAETATCALLAAGRRTGLVIDMGHTDTILSPILDGKVVKDEVLCMGFGGEDVLDRMFTVMEQNATTNTTGGSGSSGVVVLSRQNPMQRMIMKRAKESLGYVAASASEFQQIRMSQVEGLREPAERFEMEIGSLGGGDGTTYNFEAEAIEGPEIYFQPSLQGEESPPIHEVAASIIENMDDHAASACAFEDWSSTIPILLIGESSRFRGLYHRLLSELKKCLKSKKRKNRINIITSCRRHLSWVGASLLPILPTVCTSWLDRRTTYDDEGSTAVHRHSLCLRSEDASWAAVVLGMDDCFGDGDDCVDERFRYVMKALLRQNQCCGIVWVRHGAAGGLIRLSALRGLLVIV